MPSTRGFNVTIHAPERTSFAVRLDSVSKVYGSGETAVRALDNVSPAMPRGTFTAVMGPHQRAAGRALAMSPTNCRVTNKSPK
jgi:hypothetical protein